MTEPRGVAIFTLLPMVDERDFHDYQLMMRDDIRMGAYGRAIQQVCRGKTVCEVGLGMGPLTLMALRAGASRVYGIEVRPDVLEVAEQRQSFSPEAIQGVKDFLADPIGWSAAHGGRGAD